MPIVVDISSLRTFDYLAELIRDLDPSQERELVRLLDSDTRGQVRLRFRQRRDPDGRRWQPRKKAYPHPILFKSGDLYRSIKVENLEQSADTPYAGVHQYGSRSQNIPARRYLGWGANDLEEIEHTADQFLDRWLGRVLG